MKKIYELENNYISVQDQSYGGSQTYFRGVKGAFNKGRNLGGCGIVAIGDTISYLKNDTEFSSIDEYRSYFKSISKNALWIPTRLGLNFIHITLAAKSIFRKNKLSYKIKWCFSRKKLYTRIKGMLINNIPVILCIPKILKPSKNKEELSFYDCSVNKVSKTHGHFVTVTGIYEDNNKLYLQISSWGKKFYISFEEYVQFSKHHIFGFLGNILYIEPSSTR